MAKHIVKQGQCLENISLEKGFFWQTLWNHSENAQLKRIREDPNVLLPGDEIFIPDKRKKTETVATDQRHRFRRKGVPSEFCVVVKHHRKLITDSPYRLDVDGSLFTGRTNQQGKIKIRIPPDARKAKLIVGDGGDELEYEIDFGHLDPISSETGVQTRLRNLGFGCGDIDGVLGPRTLGALGDFQEQYDLTVTNELDDPTREKLRQAYGR